MSRSKKKHNIGGVTTAPSEKNDKNIWHKIFRRKNKTLVKKANDETLFVTENDVIDVWQMDKDGKAFNPTEEGRRK